MSAPLLLYSNTPLKSDPRFPGRQQHDPGVGRLAYHTGIKSIVCIDCRSVLIKEFVYGHLENQHKEELVLCTSHTSATVNAHLQRFLSPLDLDNKGPMAAYGLETTIPAFTWLQPPAVGGCCALCLTACFGGGQFGGESMKSHLRKKHGLHNMGQGSVSNATALANTVPCLVQNFNGGFNLRTHFRVHSVASESTASSFDHFINNDLPTFSRNKAIRFQNQTVDIDLPPFLKKVKWTTAIKEYSESLLRATVGYPSRGDLLSVLNPLGVQLLGTSLFNAPIPPEILEGLTAYRTRPCVIYSSVYIELAI